MMIRPQSQSQSQSAMSLGNGVATSSIGHIDVIHHSHYLAAQNTHETCCAARVCVRRTGTSLILFFKKVS